MVGQVREGALLEDAICRPAGWVHGGEGHLGPGRT